MQTHLLPLSTIAATLPVLFGPDGAFPGAPLWLGPVAFSRADGSFQEWTAIEDMQALRQTPAALTRLALDLRVPSVAARVAGLCARALAEKVAGRYPMDGWCARANPTGTPPYGYLRGHGRQITFRVQQGCFGAGPVVLPARAFASDADFLASLYLALAQRIAALGGSP